MRQESQGCLAMYSISKKNNDEVSEDLFVDDLAVRGRANTLEDMVSDLAPESNDETS